MAFGVDGTLYAALWERDELLLSAAHDKLELFHLVPGLSGYTWNSVVLDSAMTARYFPKVRADRLGRVWVGATTRRDKSAGIQLCRVDPGSDTCVFQAEITQNVDTLIAEPVLPFPNTTFKHIRVGQAFDFQVNVTGPIDFTEIRAVYHHDASPVVIHVIDCQANQFTALSCSLRPEWGTDGFGQSTVQPTLSLTDRSTLHDGSGATWEYAFITGTQRVLPTPAPIANVFSNTMSSGTETIRADNKISPDVCVAQYPTAGYWGDFIGYAGFNDPRTGLWAHAATWSSDNLRGCSPTNIWQGRQLHVAASEWTDITQ